MGSEMCIRDRIEPDTVAVLMEPPSRVGAPAVSFMPTPTGSGLTEGVASIVLYSQFRSEHGIDREHSSQHTDHNRQFTKLAAHGGMYIYTLHA